MDDKERAKMAQEDRDYLRDHAEHGEEPGDDADEEIILEPGDLPPFFQPKEKGERVTGEVRSVRKSKYGPTAHLMTAAGMVSVPKSAAMADVNFEKLIGRIVTVTFMGNVETQSGRQMRDYKITARKEKTPF
jgi:hypothetical protein